MIRMEVERNEEENVENGAEWCMEIARYIFDGLNSCLIFRVNSVVQACLDKMHESLGLPQQHALVLWQVTSLFLRWCLYILPIG